MYHGVQHCDFGDSCGHNDSTGCGCYSNTVCTFK